MHVMAILTFRHWFMHHRALELSPFVAFKTDGSGAHIGLGQSRPPAFMASITLTVFKGRMRCLIEIIRLTVAVRIMTILTAVSTGGEAVMAAGHFFSTHLMTTLTNFICLGNEQGGIGRAVSGVTNAAVLNSRRMGLTMLPARGNFLMAAQTKGLLCFQQILTNGRAVRGMAAKAFFLSKGLMGEGQGQLPNLLLMTAQAQSSSRTL